MRKKQKEKHFTGIRQNIITNNYLKNNINLKT